MITRLYNILFEMPFDHEFSDNMHLADLFYNNLTLYIILCFNSVTVSDSSVSKNSVNLMYLKTWLRLYKPAHSYSYILFILFRNRVYFQKITIKIGRI